MAGILLLITGVFSVLALYLFITRKLDAEIAAVWIVACILYIAAALCFNMFNLKINGDLITAILFAAVSAQCIILGVSVNKIRIKLKKLMQETVIGKGKENIEK